MSTMSTKAAQTILDRQAEREASSSEIDVRAIRASALRIARLASELPQKKQHDIKMEAAAILRLIGHDTSAEAQP